MKNRYLLVPTIGLFVATPAMAQSNAVNNAVRGTMTQTPISPPPPQPVYIPPPAPPAPLWVPPPRASVDPEQSYPKNPFVVNYQESSPKPSDYPVESWQKDEQGTVVYRMMIDAEGKATDCIIEQTSGFEALDVKTCEIAMERTEFRPGMKDKDTPIAGSVVRNYTWLKRSPELPDMRVTFEYLHDERGQSSECKIIKLEGDITAEMRRDLDRNIERNNGCPFNKRAGGGVPYRDENGVPVAKRVTVTFNVEVQDPAE